MNKFGYLRILWLILMLAVIVITVYLIRRLLGQV